MVVTQDRHAEVDRLLVLAARWASVDRDVAALALVGSWARGAQCMSSDVDLVILTPNLNRYARSNTWLRYFGSPPLLRTRQWGIVTERRVRLDSGLEIEFGFTSPAWAAVSPVDPGTRRVAGDGLHPLHDREGLLATLVAAVEPSDRQPEIGTYGDHTSDLGKTEIGNASTPSQTRSKSRLTT